MNRRVSTVLCSVAAVLLLVGFAFAITAPDLRAEAKQSYLDAAPADDEYAFLFDE